jgi:3-oxoacyl-[acyl-carrier-protein] synthase II
MTSLGLDADATWQGVAQGRSGIAPIQAYNASSLPSRIAGELRGFDAKVHVDKSMRKGLRMMARTLQLAVAIAHKAMEHGKVDRSKLDVTRFGVEFGASLVAIELGDLAEASLLSAKEEPRGKVDLDIWGDKSIPTIQPTFMLKYLPNFLASHVSILLDAQGPNNSITESEAAGLLALGEAFRILQRDGADFFLVGSAESKINPLSMVRQTLFEQLSRRNDDPTRAHRPFDKDRDGLVLGEGGTVFVFETLDHARQRGAKIYAEVLGFGAAFDLHRDGAGLARAIRAALEEANLGPEDIDHVNAHGMATTESDIVEASALRQVFGDRVPPVVAYKAHFGNQGAGGGLTELAISLLAQEHGALPGTLNYETPDPACPVPVHTGAPRPIAKPAFLKLAFTNRGQCAAAVVRRWSP